MLVHIGVSILTNGGNFLNCCLLPGATPYSRAERFAGGRFAMMSDGSDSLGAWTARDRPIANRDIVAWYTVGFHHITRMEDWPVMPTHWFGCTLMPHNFFATNPAMTIRDVK